MQKRYKSISYGLELTQLTFVYTMLMRFNAQIGRFYFRYFQFVYK